MNLGVLLRNLLCLTLMSFYASCGREDIFDDQRDLAAQTFQEDRFPDTPEGEVNGSKPS